MDRVHLKHPKPKQNRDALKIPRTCRQLPGNPNLLLNAMGQDNW